MFSRAIKEHQASNAGKRESLEALRKQAIAGSDGVSNEVVDILNSGYDMNGAWQWFNFAAVGIALPPL